MADRVLITGANGFIGSHLVRSCLEQGAEVIAWIGPSGDTWRLTDVLDQITVVHGEMLNGNSKEAAIIKARADICFHLAWYVKPASYRTSLVNISWIKATSNLFNLLAKHGCKHFIGAGTCFEYDTTQGNLREDSLLKPQNLYSACKLASYNILTQLAKETDMKYSWARIFYQYGPCESPRRVVPYIINKLLAEEQVDLSSGIQIKDYLYISDVADALCEVYQHSITGAVNIGSGKRTSIGEIATILGQELNKTDLINLGGRRDNPDEPRYICADNSKLISNSNWAPQYTIVEGLKKTIEWFKENPADLETG